VRRLIVAAAVLGAFGFGTAGIAQAQIVYGYSTTLDYGGTAGVMLSSGYYPGNYTAGTSIYISGGYSSRSSYGYGGYSSGSSGYGGYGSGGSGYSPLSVYVPLYPPMVSNYRLSPVSMYGSFPNGMGSGFGGMNWMSAGPGGFNPMWMRRR